MTSRNAGRRRLGLAITHGAVALGLIDGLAGVNFSEVLTSFLSTLLAVIFTLFFGGTADTLFNSSLV